MKTLISILTVLPLLCFSQNNAESLYCLDFQQDTIWNTSLNPGITNELIYEINGIKIYGNINNPNFGDSFFYTLNNLYVHNVLATFDLTNLENSTDYKKITFLASGCGLDTTKINHFNINGFDENTLPKGVSYSFENSAIWGVLMITIEGEISNFTVGPFTEIDNLCIEPFFSIPTTTNQQQIKNESIKIYPNPITDLGIVDIPEKKGPYYIFIYDVLGNIVRVIEGGNSKKQIIEKGALKTGVYLFNIEFVYEIGASEENYSGRFIVK